MNIRKTAGTCEQWEGGKKDGLVQGGVFIRDITVFDIQVAFVT